LELSLENLNLVFLIDFAVEAGICVIENYNNLTKYLLTNK
jgi:hypothetical protein